MKYLRFLAAAGVALLCSGVSAPAAPGSAVRAAPRWLANPADNICGLAELSQLSNPAKVNFPSVLDSTSEMKKLRALGLDPSSPRGIQLRTAAVDRVAQVCDIVRRELGHCSVWKAIRHQDGREIPDITKKALALL